MTRPDPDDESEQALAEAQVIVAMCKAHDREESAQKGEPSPWREDFGPDPDWEQERFLAMREAFDVAKAALVPEGFALIEQVALDQLLSDSVTLAVVKKVVA